MTAKINLAHDRDRLQIEVKETVERQIGTLLQVTLSAPSLAEPVTLTLNFKQAAALKERLPSMKELAMYSAGGVTAY